MDVSGATHNILARSQHPLGKPGPQMSGTSKDGARTAAPAGETSAAAASKDSDDTAVALPGTDLTVCLACCRSEPRRGCTPRVILPASRATVCEGACCAFRSHHGHVSAGVRQEEEAEKMMAPESAAEEEERLRQQRKQDTERALQVCTHALLAALGCSL